MYNENSEMKMAFFIVLLVMCIFVFGEALKDYTICNAKTADIGFEHRWSYLGGCQVEVLPNQWIPLENYYFKQEKQ